MGCCYRLCEEQTASWPTARANCALLKSRENLSMSRRSQNLYRFVLFLETQWGVEGRMFPFFLSVYLPSLPLSPSSLFHRSLPLSQSCSLPSLTAFLWIIFMLSLPLFLFCLSLPLSLGLFSALQLFPYHMNASVTSATTEDTCHLGHPDWLKFQRVQCRWVGGGLTGGSATDTTDRDCAQMLALQVWVQENFWSGLQHFFSSQATVITVIHSFTVVTSALSNLSSCTPLPTCP